MDVLDFPDIAPTATSWSYLTNTGLTQSPITKAILTSGRAGDRWGLQVNMQTLCDDDRAVMLGFMLGLKGFENRFRFYDRTAFPRSTALNANIRVDGAGQKGNRIQIKNLTPNAQIAAFDQLMIGGQLVRVAYDQVSDAGGNALVEVRPSIRKATVDNDLILSLILNDPIFGADKFFATFVLTSPNFSWDNINNLDGEFGYSSNVVFTAEEDLSFTI